MSKQKKEKYFGVVRWCSEDIKNALEVKSIPVTPENVGKLLDAVNTHHFTDHMISAGWDYIYEMINNVDFEQKEENIRFCSVCGKPITSGFVVDDGAEYYCSVSCLHRVYTEEEYKTMYSEGYACWTEWEE